MRESEITPKEIGVRQVGIVCRGCVRRSCSRVVCLSGRVGGLRVEGKEVTKCYMRVTAPFPTQTDTAQNEDIILLFSPQCKEAGDISHPDFAPKRKINGTKDGLYAPCCSF